MTTVLKAAGRLLERQPWIGPANSSTRIARSTRPGQRPGRVLVYDSASFLDASAKWITRAVESTIRLRGHCTLLVVGATPRAVCERMMVPWLAGRVAWNRVTRHLYDENRVAGNDAQPGHLDVLLLDLCEDGHIAPLIARAIRAAERTFVLAAGLEKARAVARALKGAYTHRERRRPPAFEATWILDHAAARELPCGPPQTAQRYWHCPAMQSVMWCD